LAVHRNGKDREAAILLGEDYEYADEGIIPQEPLKRVMEANPKVTWAGTLERCSPLLPVKPWVSRVNESR